MTTFPYKRSEIVFVKDDDGHDYCVHQDDEDDFYTWNELMGEYWEPSSSLPDLYNYDEWFKFNNYNGKDFSDMTCGCAPNYFLKITEFQPE